MNCDNHPGTEAAVLVTNLGDGDTFAGCSECLLAFCEGVVREARAAAKAAAADQAGPTGPGEAPQGRRRTTANRGGGGRGRRQPAGSEPATVEPGDAGGPPDDQAGAGGLDGGQEAVPGPS